MPSCNHIRNCITLLYEYTDCMSVSLLGHGSVYSAGQLCKSILDASSALACIRQKPTAAAQFCRGADNDGLVWLRALT